MEGIKRFFSDDSGSSELVSSLVLIGTVLVVGAVGVGLYYGSINNFFGKAQTSIDGITIPALPLGGAKTP